MANAYRTTSHLRNTPIINGYADVYRPPMEPDYNKVEYFTITQKYHRRPDLLAYDKYGESRFWWVFALYNKNSIVDPINDFTLGKTILVPYKNTVAGT